MAWTIYSSSAESINSRGDQICVHLHWVTKCPPNFPFGYYWYGDCRYVPGRSSKWISQPVPTQNTSLPESANKTEEPSGEDFEEASDLEPKLDSSANQPTVTQEHLQKPFKFTCRNCTRTVASQTISPPEYSAWAKVKEGVCNIC